MTAAETGPAAETPRPVADIDKAVGQALKGFHRQRWIGIAAVIAALALAVAMLAAVAVQQQTRLRASCGFWLGLAPLPVTIAPGQAKPARTGVTLIGGARTAYQGQGCGKLPPAAPSLQQWAAYYHIRVP